MPLQEIHGDLFSSTGPLAHCVSADFKMGAGIAREFLRRWGDGMERKSVGDVSVFPVEERRYIYYLVTKERYFLKPTYQTLESSLRVMYSHCLQHGIRKVSMPRIGCGLDKLDWSVVRPMIERIFLQVEVDVYYLID